MEQNSKFGIQIGFSHLRKDTYGLESVLEHNSTLGFVGL